MAKMPQTMQTIASSALLVLPSQDTFNEVNEPTLTNTCNFAKVEGIIILGIVIFKMSKGYDKNIIHRLAIQNLLPWHGNLV